MPATCLACGRVFGTVTRRAVHDCPEEASEIDVPELVTDGGTAPWPSADDHGVVSDEVRDVRSDGEGGCHAHEDCDEPVVYEYDHEQGAVTMTRRYCETHGRAFCDESDRIALTDGGRNTDAVGALLLFLDEHVDDETVLRPSRVAAEVEYPTASVEAAFQKLARNAGRNYDIERQDVAGDGSRWHIERQDSDEGGHPVPLPDGGDSAWRGP